ncbi:oligopeptidase A [Xenorhabdus cabanillasii]|uniref:oligopeptidase A n=1 Tax=Xenorhabdus cabanillasii JM26 TaxID=1427517 RepID=W1J9I0_9GAMM|nr:oligopeptidase A [Xenorhabdus cabanillasii]PHM77061.1 oligopeptidase A [Xenorhabdus cabanillasii JM26]CDL86160.1 Oligopeptidase A [Xenorhabdus cabanillasii JM26]
MTNPLLESSGLPKFASIKAEHVVPAVKERLANYRQVIEKVLAENTPFTWDNLCQPISEAKNQFGRVWSPVKHLNAVKNSPEFRVAYEQCLRMVAEFDTWMGQHKGLYQAYKSLKENPAFRELSQSQRKTIEDKLLDFTLSGVALPEEKQKRYGEITARLSELSSQFGNNVLDATMGWTKLITDECDLSGLPESTQNAAKAAAKAKGLDGWLLTLDPPIYNSVMSYADDRDLREEIYIAYITRASELGPNACKWDNTPIMEEILALRHELALLLGFKNYAGKSLATKMAKTPKEVLDFLNDLVNRAHCQGEREMEELCDFAFSHYWIDDLEDWDVKYYSEKQKQHDFSFDEEQLRAYFPEQRALDGLFEVVRRIYGITAKPRENVETWHPDVRFFDLYDDKGILRGSCYLDLYARANKRGGAWKSSYVDRMRLASGELQTPVVFINCNFNGPVGDKPALFTHSEVKTLFHEFGHGLHSMLTLVETLDVAGTNGVPWDAVECPSQFMENWCWEPEALEFISGHYETKEPLPKEMLDNMLAAKNFQSAMLVLRQLKFGLFDFRLHVEYDPAKGAQILPIYQSVEEHVSVVPSQDDDRFPNSFSHIFNGSYAAGYYSYMWADVLAADAYSRFSEEGIFNRTTGQSFLDDYLTLGGSMDPMTLFIRFRGRKPSLDALLKRLGITE